MAVSSSARRPGQLAVKAGQVTTGFCMCASGEQTVGIARLGTCRRDMEEDDSQYTSAPCGRHMATARTGTVAHSITVLRAPITYAMTALLPVYQRWC